MALLGLVKRLPVCFAEYSRHKKPFVILNKRKKEPDAAS